MSNSSGYSWGDQPSKQREADSIAQTDKNPSLNCKPDCLEKWTWSE